jgi:hypothetical protein
VAGYQRWVNREEFNRICSALLQNHSVLVLGETGVGINELAEDIFEHLLGDKQCAIAIYKGSVKKFLETIAFELDIPTTETRYNSKGEPTGEKSLTVDALKEEIAANCGDDTLFILPEAKRLTTSIRYWLEELMSNGVTVCCFAAANPGKDIFLEMLEVELSLPSDRHIREVMEAEANRQGLNLSKSRLAELQPLAGRNPMLAKKVIRNEKLGLNKQGKPEHTQYVVIMPVIVAALLAFGIVRFVGMGTGNKGLYITGGCCLVTGMALKQLGSVRGARKRLGQ